ncbi:hypothetical protein F5Y19DRAFT_4737 [Xylariaceae sp. FL1651]|nr:hypothetical protein F5Y19DRAFT_4737 [Xylariaceae sp. FL1651]
MLEQISSIWATQHPVQRVLAGCTSVFYGVTPYQVGIYGCVVGISLREHIFTTVPSNYYIFQHTARSTCCWNSRISPCLSCRHLLSTLNAIGQLILGILFQYLYIDFCILFVQPRGSQGKRVRGKGASIADWSPIKPSNQDLHKPRYNQQGLQGGPWLRRLLS